MFRLTREGRAESPHLFLHHAVLGVVALEVEAEEAGPVEHVFEVPEADLPERLADGGHEGRHCPLGEVDHLGGRLLHTCGFGGQVSMKVRLSDQYVND